MFKLLLVLALLAPTSWSASAQGLQAVRPLPGYTCMQLANPPPPTLDPTKGVPVRNAPSRSAPVASWSPFIVLVPLPLAATEGFLQAMFADKHTGWIAASDLKPWSTPYKQNQHCFPSVMSNGTVGFDFR
jgi:hypothetical protein